MKVNPVVVAIALTFCTQARAQKDVDIVVAMNYSMSLFFPRLAEVCSQHIPGYADESRPVFLAWKVRWNSFIEAGQRDFERAARLDNLDQAYTDKLLEEVIQRPLDQFRRLSAEVIVQKCTDGLKAFIEDSPTETLNRALEVRVAPRQ